MRFIVALALPVLTPSLSLAGANSYIVDVRVAEVDGALPDELLQHAATLPLAVSDIDGKTTDAPEQAFRFTSANCRIGDSSLQMDGAQLSWDDRDDSTQVVTFAQRGTSVITERSALTSPLPDAAPDQTEQYKWAWDFLRRHWSPDLPVNVRSFVVGQDDDGYRFGYGTVVYFERKPGNLYQRKWLSNVHPGYAWSCVLKSSNTNQSPDTMQFYFCDKRILWREPLKNVNLAIGKPTLSRVAIETELTLVPEHWLGIVIPAVKRGLAGSESGSNLFVFVRLHNPEPAAGAVEYSTESHIIRLRNDEATRFNAAVIPYEKAACEFGDAQAFQSLRLETGASNDWNDIHMWIKESLRNAELLSSPRITSMVTQPLSKIVLNTDDEARAKLLDGKGVSVQKLSNAWERFDPHISTIMSSLGAGSPGGHAALIMDWKEGSPPRGYAIIVNLSSIGGSDLFSADYSCFVHAEVKDSILNHFRAAKPLDLVDQNAFRYRFQIADGAWAGFTYPMADTTSPGDRIVVLVRFDRVYRH